MGIILFLELTPPGYEIYTAMFLYVLLRSDAPELPGLVIYICRTLQLLKTKLKTAVPLLLWYLELQVMAFPKCVLLIFTQNFL